jgi:galactokinase/galactose-1-phosphate uridylyltransferase (family 1)
VSELRWHPFLEQWVITATHRQDRTFLPPADYCPLCPTRPGGFPTEVPEPTYDIVVFENKFPSLQAAPPEPAVAATSLSPVEPAKGVCEVVVYSPRHEDALASMPLERIQHLARVWKDRYLELGARDFVRYVFIFENRGEAVGVTLHHPHGQIYAFPFIPPLIEKELAASRRFHAENGRCLMCASLAEEIRDGRRIVLEGERFVAWVPFHARWPYEVTLASRAHQISMEEWNAADMEDLAAVLKGLLQKYDALFAKPFPYIMVVHQAPTDGEDHRHAHLHFEFYTPQRAPDRLKFLAGVESGAGNFINDKLAEESAAELRRVGPASVAAVRAADEAGRERAPAGIGGGTGHDPAAPRPASSMADALRTAFGPGGTAVTAFAPGRVNLIGEHTDYNDGFVLPMAIEDGIEMAARSRAGREIRAHAVDLGETVAFSLEQPIRPDPTRPWSNYIRGVLWALSRAGVALGGMDLAFGGTLPQGAGLSSSAALQVATALTARALLRFTMDVPRLARICQESENELVGVKVGIMDPFVSLAAREGHALFLDCRSLAFEQVPLALGDHVVAICYSGVKHALVASEYNVRRRQCAAGVEVLRTHDPRIRALRDASLEALEACRAELDPVVYRRCRHVVTENARVLESKSALRTGDLRRFGELMDASHASLRDDYQVSCAEIDLLVDLARQSQGVLGARITGGGFGGCTVNLVARGAVESFRKEVLGEYRRRTGLDGWVFVSEAADGASTAGEVG